MKAPAHPILPAFLAGLLLPALSFGMGFHPKKGDAASADPAVPALAVPAQDPAATPGGLPPLLASDSEDGKVGQVVANIIGRFHYLHHPLDSDMAQLFLKTYVDYLDYRHMVFLQTDIDEFNSKYGPALGILILGGDVTPARAIYDRYLQRLKERQAKVEELLKKPFDFTKDESFTVDRSKAPWPKDADEADELWRLQIKYEMLEALLNKKKPEDAAKEISRHYARLLKTAQEVDHEDLLGDYLTSLTHAYDPHSDYFTPEEANNFRISTIDLKLSGIGAVLRTEDGYPEIVSLVPGGPADLDRRLKPNDKIVAVAQDGGKPVDVIDMKLNKVVEMIRGPQKTKVVLTVIPGDATDTAVRHEITIVRDEVKLTNSQARGRLYERQTASGTTQRFGMVILPEFYENSAKDVATIVRRLQQEKVDGLILDLRRNGGGILEEAVNIVSLFVPSGPVVQVKDQQGAVRPYDIPGDNLLYTGPLVVLAGKSSASASEIVAAALQDYGRALTVGDRTTFGKGTVQNLIDLKNVNWSFSSDPGQLKLTIQKFYRIAGGTTQNRGVSSDIVLPSANDYLPMGESMLPNAMPADEIPPAKFQRVSPPFASLPQLQSRSTDRIAKNPEFATLKEEIDLLKQRLDDKTVSLNREKRTAERDTAEALKAKEKKLAGLPPSAFKVSVIDLDMIEKNQPLKLVTKAAVPPGADAAKDDDDDGLSNSPNAVFRDIDLDETVNILVDYAALLAHPGSALASQDGN